MTGTIDPNSELAISATNAVQSGDLETLWRRCWQRTRGWRQQESGMRRRLALRSIPPPTGRDISQTIEQLSNF